MIIIERKEKKRKETDDSFWLIQCASTLDTITLYMEDFAQWCATIAPIDELQ